MRLRTTLIETVCALLFFAGFAAAASIIACPVPWAPESGRGDNAYGTSAGITFKNVTGSGKVSIYTITGEQVAQKDFSVPDEAKWDGLNSDGAAVASGVYLWVVQTDDVTETGKLIVIR